jgi:outer membrane protein W
MKQKLIIISALLLLLSVNSFAQDKFSIGVVVTRFENIGDDSRMSQIDNPLGFGIIGAYQISNDITFALTGEYFKGDMENVNGDESDYRAHLSVNYHPITFYKLRPYISAGLVVSHKSFSFNFATTDETSKTNIYERYGVGIDYPLISNLTANVDLGFYNDGIKIAGWSGSIGLRYSF